MGKEFLPPVSRTRDDEESPRLLSIRSAAARYDVSEGLLRALVAERRIRYFKLVGTSGRPHAIRLDPHDLDAMFQPVEPAIGARVERPLVS